MASTRPYLIRAIYEWAQENNLTPHILVDATQPNVDVPREFIEDDKIILNVAGSAVADLVLGNDSITFNARFAGTAREICIPTSAVRAIYARENGIGIVLPEEPESQDPAMPPDPPGGPDSSRGSHLKVVK
jgi:stringent starvation protein B